ncbi:hypothetical protein ScPMuIL_004186 [Solemya velum]
MAGCVSPGWLRIALLTFELDMGIWYLCFEGSCASYTALANSVGSNSYASTMHTGFLEYQIEIVLALLSGIAGVVLIFVFTKPENVDNKCLRIIAEVCFAISGICGWIPTGKFATFYVSFNVFGSFAFPYSVLLTGFGATLAFITLIMIIISRCKGGSSGQVIYPTQTVAYSNTAGPAYPNTAGAVYPIATGVAYPNAAGVTYPDNAGYGGDANQPPPPPAKY